MNNYSNFKDQESKPKSGYLEIGLKFMGAIQQSQEEQKDVEINTQNQQVENIKAQFQLFMTSVKSEQAFEKSSKSNFQSMMDQLRGQNETKNKHLQSLQTNLVQAQQQTIEQQQHDLSQSQLTMVSSFYKNIRAFPDQTATGEKPESLLIQLNKLKFDLKKTEDHFVIQQRSEEILLQMYGDNVNSNYRVRNNIDEINRIRQQIDFREKHLEEENTKLQFSDQTMQKELQRGTKYVENDQQFRQVKLQNIQLVYSSQNQDVQQMLYELKILRSQINKAKKEIDIQTVQIQNLDQQYKRKSEVLEHHEILLNDIKYFDEIGEIFLRDCSKPERDEIINEQAAEIKGIQDAELESEVQLKFKRIKNLNNNNNSNEDLTQRESNMRTSAVAQEGSYQHKYNLGGNFILPNMANHTQQSMIQLYNAQSSQGDEEKSQRGGQFEKHNPIHPFQGSVEENHGIFTVDDIPRNTNGSVDTQFYQDRVQRYFEENENDQILALSQNQVVNQVNYFHSQYSLDDFVMRLLEIHEREIFQRETLSRRLADLSTQQIDLQYEIKNLDQQIQVFQQQQGKLEIIEQLEDEYMNIEDEQYHQKKYQSDVQLRFEEASKHNFDQMIEETQTFERFCVNCFLFSNEIVFRFTSMILAIPKLGRPYENMEFEDNMQLFYEMAKSIKNYYFDTPNLDADEESSELNKFFPNSQENGLNNDLQNSQDSQKNNSHQSQNNLASPKSPNSGPKDSTQPEEIRYSVAELENMLKGIIVDPSVKEKDQFIIDIERIFSIIRNDFMLFNFVPRKLICDYVKREFNNYLYSDECDFDRKTKPFHFYFIEHIHQIKQKAQDIFESSLQLVLTSLQEVFISLYEEMFDIHNLQTNARNTLLPSFVNERRKKRFVRENVNESLGETKEFIKKRQRDFISRMMKMKCRELQEYYGGYTGFRTKAQTIVDVIYEAIYNIKRGREDDIPYDNAQENNFFEDKRVQTQNQLLNELIEKSAKQQIPELQLQEKYGHLSKSLQFERLELAKHDVVSYDQLYKETLLENGFDQNINIPERNQKILTELRQTYSTLLRNQIDDVAVAAAIKKHKEEKRSTLSKIEYPTIIVDGEVIYAGSILAGIGQERFQSPNSKKQKAEIDQKQTGEDYSEVPSTMIRRQVERRLTERMYKPKSFINTELDEIKGGNESDSDTPTSLDPKSPRIVKFDLSGSHEKNESSPKSHFYNRSENNSPHISIKEEDQVLFKEVENQQDEDEDTNEIQMKLFKTHEAQQEKSKDDSPSHSQKIKNYSEKQSQSSSSLKDRDQILNQSQISEIHYEFQENLKNEQKNSHQQEQNRLHVQPPVQTEFPNQSMTQRVASLSDLRDITHHKERYGNENNNLQNHRKTNSSVNSEQFKKKIDFASKNLVLTKHDPQSFVKNIKRHLVHGSMTERNLDIKTSIMGSLQQVNPSSVFSSETNSTMTNYKLFKKDQPAQITIINSKVANLSPQQSFYHNQGFGNNVMVLGIDDAQNTFSTFKDFKSDFNQVKAQTPSPYEQNLRDLKRQYQKIENLRSLKQSELGEKSLSSLPKIITKSQRQSIQSSATGFPEKSDSNKLIAVAFKAKQQQLHQSSSASSLSNLYSTSFSFNQLHPSN